MKSFPAPGRYPWRAIASSTFGRWSRDDLALLRYRKSSATGTRDVVSQLILDFKDGHDHAERVVTEIVLMALHIHEADFRDRAQARYVVGIPSSTSSKPAGPVWRLTRAIAREFSWLDALPPLQRVTAVPKSSTAAPGERPTVDVHLASLAWIGPQVNIPDNSIIMVDDVITRGATSEAARRVIRAATHARSVLGLFVGRTIGDDHWTPPDVDDNYDR